MLDTQTFDKPLGGFSRDAPAPNDLALETRTENIDSLIYVPFHCPRLEIEQGLAVQ